MVGMKCPECGHDERAGADICSQCPHIFEDASTDSTPRTPQIVYFALMAIAMGMIIFGALMFETGQKKFQAEQTAAENKPYDHEKLMKDVNGFTSSLDKAGKALTRVTKKVPVDPRSGESMKEPSE